MSSFLATVLRNVRGGRVAGVDDVVGMQDRDVGAADAEALEPRFLDEHPRRFLPRRVLEHRAATRLVERRALLAPPQQPALHLLELGGRLFAEPELRLEHDDLPQPARPVLERDLFARQRLDLALGVHHRDFGDDLGELRSVGAGVHVHATAHRPGDAEEPLHACEPGLRGAAREQRGWHARPDDRDRALHLELVEPLAKPDDEAGEAAVLDEHVRAQPEHQPGHALVLRELERLLDVLDFCGVEEIARRPTDAIRGVAGERLVLEHPAPELELGRRRGRCRGLRDRLDDRLRYACTARGSRFPGAGFPTGCGGFSGAVFSCHSWRLLTLPARLRNAMIASQAALAADIVVV